MLHVAVGAVLETDGARQTRRELAMHLAFGGARADGAPGNQIGDVLRRDHVEKLAARRHAHSLRSSSSWRADAQTVVDAKAAVKIGVVDQPFPTDGGARFLEIDAHDDQQIGDETVFGFFQFAGVFLRGFDVVDRAGAQDHQQAIIGAVQDAVDFLACFKDRFSGFVRYRKIAEQARRRSKLFDFFDAQVVGLVLCHNDSNPTNERITISKNH